MAYDSLRQAFDKEHVYIVEIGAVKFIRPTSKNLKGLEAIPTLKSISISPSKIDLNGGLGLRASASLTFDEHVDYSVFGTPTQGRRYWARWAHENPYYRGDVVKIYSGYISDGAYDIANFTVREYILESFSYDGRSAKVSVSDPLKLADDKRAQAPRESTGTLSANVLASDFPTASITLEPVGVGAAEYPVSGVARLGDEIVTFSRSFDNMTITRAQYNTAAADHDAGDVLQLCLEYSSQSVSDIVYDLITNYTEVNPSYIDKTQWDNEVADAFTVSYSTLITEPKGVNALIKEFAESAPHYLYWDERASLIRLSALKPPADSSPLYTHDDHIVEDSFKYSDMHDMRISTIVVAYGQYDPTRPLDEFSNYRNKYVREDSSSVTNYGQRQVKTVYSRWITSVNKTAAVLMAARVGRRFASTPRQITVELEAKDGGLWLGDSARFSSEIIVDELENPKNILYQILSAAEARNFKYTALEHTYGDAVAADDDAEDPNVRLIFIQGTQDQLKDDGGTPRTLRDIYDEVYPGDYDTGYDIRFIFEPTVLAGSSTNTAAGISTGVFSGLVKPILLDVRTGALIVGKGGDGSLNTASSPENGGPALNLQTNIRLSNAGIIGGGGGGGQGDGDTNVSAGGGGGAGYTVGQGATNTIANLGGETIVDITSSANGSNETGGDGGFVETTDGGENTIYQGGFGGALGANGGATAGKAIDLNGNSITYIQTGDIRGTVS